MSDQMEDLLHGCQSKLSKVGDLPYGCRSEPSEVGDLVVIDLHQTRWEIFLMGAKARSFLRADRNRAKPYDRHPSGERSRGLQL